MTTLGSSDGLCWWSGSCGGGHTPRSLPALLFMYFRVAQAWVLGGFPQSKHTCLQSHLIFMQLKMLVPPMSHALLT